ncbi:hypothetical protein VTK56DRAFT_3272 [Thermocarpiscus australiensis]
MRPNPNAGWQLNEVAALSVCRRSLPAARARRCCLDQVCIKRWRAARVHMVAGPRPISWHLGSARHVPCTGSRIWLIAARAIKLGRRSAVMEQLSYSSCTKWSGSYIHNTYGTSKHVQWTYLRVHSVSRSMGLRPHRSRMAVSTNSVLGHKTVPFQQIKCLTKLQMRSVWLRGDMP